MKSHPEWLPGLLKVLPTAEQLQNISLTFPVEPCQPVLVHMVAIQHQDVFSALLLSPDGSHRLPALALGHSGIPHCHHHCDCIPDRAAIHAPGSRVRASKFPKCYENRPQRYFVCAVRSHPGNGHLHTCPAAADLSIFANVIKTPNDGSCCRDNRWFGSGGLRAPGHYSCRGRDDTRLYVYTREAAGHAECRVASRHCRRQHALTENLLHFLEAAEAGPWPRHWC